MRVPKTSHDVGPSLPTTSLWLNAVPHGGSAIFFDVSTHRGNDRGLISFAQKKKKSMLISKQLRVHMQMERQYFFRSFLHEGKNIFDHHMVKKKEDTWLSGKSRAYRSCCLSKSPAVICPSFSLITTR